MSTQGLGEAFSDCHHGDGGGTLGTSGIGPPVLDQVIVLHGIVTACDLEKHGESTGGWGLIGVAKIEINGRIKCTGKG